ncbi:MAG: hypothetical protein P8166_18195 [Candidatus Thiodiazotropha sp.]|jgi:hypothetical protein
MGNRRLHRSFLGAIYCASLLLAATPSKGGIIRLKTPTGSTTINPLFDVEWSGIKPLINLNIPAVKPTILLGGSERCLGDDWLPAIKRAGADVIQIPGANHFFDHEHEFDLVDGVVGVLER